MTYSNVIEDSVYWTVQSYSEEKERWLDVVYRLGNDNISRFHSLDEALKWYDRSVSDEMEKPIPSVKSRYRVPPVEFRLVSNQLITSLIDSYNPYDDAGDSWELVG